jgi:hypothetical protein
MSRGFLFVHGLPGAGKTSLCRCLSQSRDDVFFADTRSSPAWGSDHMWKICADLYIEGGGDRWLVTDAMAARRSGRDRLVARTLHYLEENAGVSFDSTHIVFLQDPGSDVLSGRRKRSVEEYEALRRTMELGSATYDYTSVECAPGEAVESISLRFSRLIDSWSAGHGPSGP